MIYGTICGIIIIIVIIVVICFLIKVIFWLLNKVYHITHPELPKLKTKLLRGYLVEKYGKRQGTNIFRKLKNSIWNKYRIK